MRTAEELMELMTKNEPLHPDLEPYVSETDFGPVLQHPLVYSVPLLGPALANEQYSYKQQAVTDAVEHGNWASAIWLHERPHRLDALWSFAEQMPDKTFWELAGEVWTDSENIWQNDRLWRAVFRQTRPHRERFMTDEEQAAFAALPDEVEVWRGCQDGLNESGMSWTTDQDKAQWFAERFARDADALVLGRTFKREEVFAVVLRRGESELIVP